MENVEQNSGETKAGEIREASDAEGFRLEWVRKRVEAWADRDLENLGTWLSKAIPFGQTARAQGPLLECGERVWNVADGLYEAGKKLGFLP